MVFKSVATEDHFQLNILRDAKLMEFMNVFIKN